MCLHSNTMTVCLSRRSLSPTPTWLAFVSVCVWVRVYVFESAECLQMHSFFISKAALVPKLVLFTSEKPCPLWQRVDCVVRQRSMTVQADASLSLLSEIKPVPETEFVND